MNVRSEIGQLVARDKEVFVGLADGTILRGKFGVAPGPAEDMIAFAAVDVIGPAKPFIRAGVLVVVNQICWIETA